MNLVFKLLLTINATSWMLIVYAIKNKWSKFSIPFYFLHIGLIFLLIILSMITIELSKKFGKESLSASECIECSIADNEFLPVYLGYFFVSLSISNCYTMVMIYIIVFVFTFLSQTQYFNPIYLLLGYHYYHIVTASGTRIFVIKKGQVIRNKSDIIFENLRRINDTTFLERG